MWTDFSSVLSQCTRLTDGRTDGRTDRQTEISSLDRVCIACSAVKIRQPATNNAHGIIFFSYEFYVKFVGKGAGFRRFVP